MKVKLICLAVILLSTTISCSNNTTKDKAKTDKVKPKNLDEKDETEDNGKPDDRMKPTRPDDEGETDDDINQADYEDDGEFDEGEGNRASGQSSPAALLELLFQTANTGEFADLGSVCAPDSDNDCKNICGLANNKQKRENYVEWFKTGKIVGKPKISGNQAEVNFTFGPDGDKEETMNMVKIKGKWYLSSF